MRGLALPSKPKPATIKTLKEKKRRKAKRLKQTKLKTLARSKKMERLAKSKELAKQRRKFKTFNPKKVRERDAKIAKSQAVHLKVETA